MSIIGRSSRSLYVSVALDVSLDLTLLSRSFPLVLPCRYDHVGIFVRAPRGLYTLEADGSGINLCTSIVLTLAPYNAGMRSRTRLASRSPLTPAASSVLTRSSHRVTHYPNSLPTRRPIHKEEPNAVSRKLRDPQAGGPVRARGRASHGETEGIREGDSWKAIQSQPDGNGACGGDHGG